MRASQTISPPYSTRKGAVSVYSIRLSLSNKHRICINKTSSIRTMKYFAKREILENKDLAEVAWQAIEPIWDDLPYSSTSKLDAFMDDLTEGQRALISIDWCQKEIRNGGFKQLFKNSTGNLVPYAIHGFRLIGAERYAELMAKGAGVLGTDYPKSGAARKRVLKSLNDSQLQELETVDDEFLNLICSTEYDLEHLRGNYVKNNPVEFFSS